MYPTTHHPSINPTPTQPDHTSTNHRSLNLPIPEICVICLDRLVDDKALATPCQHNNFHFSCLGTWLTQQRRCPLCKAEVYSVRYTDSNLRNTQIFQLPADEKNLPCREGGDDDTARRPRGGYRSRYHHHNDHGLGSQRRRRNELYELATSSTSKAIDQHDHALSVRRHVYRHNRFSLHVGANRFSRYLPAGSITPDLFATHPEHVSRARNFVRRELQVFPFLDPVRPPDSFNTSTSSHIPSQFGPNHTDDENLGAVPRKRATNREYLLEYIIAILLAIPLKGSEGQAEVLVGEYLGSQYANLFLHELEAWLRSPYQNLGEWDAAVQYKQQNAGGDGFDGDGVDGGGVDGAR